jgi:hypothetical protein
MNTFDLLKKTLSACLLVSAVALTGCDAQGDADPSGGGGNGNGGPTDVSNCEVPLGATLCVLGGDDHEGGGLVDVLLAPDGPLGPIAGAIDTSELTDVLTNLLQNDGGTLAGVVAGLIKDGQLQDGLKALLLGADGSGDNGLAAILKGVLLPNEQGQGLVKLFGPDGIQGLVMALLIDGTSSDCEAPLGTLCLIAGEGTDQFGLVDLLLTSNGLLGSLSPTLAAGVTDNVVAILGDLLASNGSLRDLLTGLTADGQLATALQVLLIGDPDQGVQSGLAQALQNLFGDLGATVAEVVAYLRSVLGLAG